MNEEAKKSQFIIEAPSIITREGHSVGFSGEERRSDHNDFATSRELVDRNFSGVRDNKIGEQREIWIDGNLAASMANSILILYPDKWEEMYRDVFGLKNVEVVTGGN